MKAYKTHNDLHFPDHITKLSDDWINIYWPVTWKCNLECSYCFRMRRNDENVIDTRTHEVIYALDRIRQKTGKNIFFSITGGEPMTLAKFPEFIEGVTRLGMQVDIATNLTLKSCEKVLDFALFENTMVQATYHECELSKNQKYADNFINNFKYGLANGVYMIFKIIVRRDDVLDLENKIAFFKEKIGMPFPIYLKVISGIPTVYTKEEQKKIFRLMTYEKEYQKLLVAGANIFKGMKCDAGRGLIVLNANGDAYRCTGTIFEKPIGNLFTGINFSKDLAPCESHACGCTPQAIKYGMNPWDYVAGAKKEDASYCKYGCPQEINIDES